MSKEEIIFRVSVEGGRLVSDALRHFAATSKGVWWFKAHQRRPRVSDAQRGYYFACVVQIPADHFGYTKDEMHDALKMMFLKKSSEGKPDTVRSLMDLTTGETTEYIEKVREWAMREYSLDIPDPKRWYESDILSEKNV